MMASVKASSFILLISCVCASNYENLNYVLMYG